MFDLATLLMGGYSNGLCRAGKDADGAIRALRVIFNVVGSLVPIPFALTVSTKFIRKSILNGKLEHLFKWGICYNKGESEKKVHTFYIPGSLPFRGMHMQVLIIYMQDRINEVADKLPDNLMSKFRDGEKKIRKLFPHGNWTEAITNNVFFI